MTFVPVTLTMTEGARRRGGRRSKGRRMTGSEVAPHMDAPTHEVSDAAPGFSPLSVSSLVQVTFPAVLLALTLGFVVRDFAQPLTNTDTFFHLRFGQEFQHGWSLRDPGPVTSQATAHWVPTQWLPEV